jgi:hypothetical protein
VEFPIDWHGSSDSVPQSSRRQSTATGRLVYAFCTYFDHRYLARGLALYRSLKQHCPSAHLWVLCFDERCYESLSTLALPDVHLIALRDFEKGDPELAAAKSTRTSFEYYVTCTPSLALFVLNDNPQIDLITYLDADLYFFSDVTPTFDEIADHSIAIVGHRFPAHLVAKHSQYGIYNVGWLSFRRDSYADACLRWWRERCLEWCYFRVEGGRFADQKYLDDWPSRFDGVVVLQHKGVNLGPWNLAGHKIHRNDSGLWVDEQPLIHFHFHGLRVLRHPVYDPNLAVYAVRPARVIRHGIYRPYIRAVAAASGEVAALRSAGSPLVDLQPGTGSPPGVLEAIQGVLTGKYLFVMGDRVL